LKAAQQLLSTDHCAAQHQTHHHPDCACPRCTIFGWRDFCYTLVIPIIAILVDMILIWIIHDSTLLKFTKTFVLIFPDKQLILPYYLQGKARTKSFKLKKILDSNPIPHPEIQIAKTPYIKGVIQLLRW
jgi:hypothetical protein